MSPEQPRNVYYVYLLINWLIIICVYADQSENLYWYISVDEEDDIYWHIYVHICGSFAKYLLLMNADQSDSVDSRVSVDMPLKGALMLRESTAYECLRNLIP
jgi:hypothetical protein